LDLYAENILDHYRHPRGKTPLTNPTVEQKEVNLSCGDEVTLQLMIENGTIVKLGWEGTGCAVSQAGMSILGEELIGMTVDDANALTQKNVNDLLGVPIGPRRFKCAYLCLHTLKNALRKATGNPPQGWTETVGGAL
jgi:nitrogen fixation protein NifU and related proteins